MDGKVDLTKGPFSDLVDKLIKIQTRWRKLLMLPHVLPVVPNNLVAILTNLFVVADKTVLSDDLSLLVDRANTGAARVPTLVGLAGSALGRAPGVAERFHVGCMGALAAAHLSRLLRL